MPLVFPHRRNSVLGLGAGICLLLAFLVFVPSAGAQNVNARDQAMDLATQAYALFEENRLQEALPLARQAVATVEAEYGPDDSDLGLHYFLLAIIEYGLQDFPPALEHMNRSLAVCETSQDCGDPFLVDVLWYLANMNFEMGDPQMGWEQGDRALAIWGGMDDIDPLMLAQAHEQHGHNLAYAGGFSQAQTHFEQTLAIQVEVLGDQDPEVADTLVAIGYCLAEQGQTPDALAMFKRALPLLVNGLGRNDPRTAGCLRSLAGAYYDLGDYTQSVAYYEQAVAAYSQDVANNARSLALSLHYLGEAHVGCRQYDQALPLFEQALEMENAQPGLLPQGFAQKLLLNMAECHEVLGNPELAAELRALAREPDGSSFVLPENWYKR